VGGTAAVYAAAGAQGPLWLRSPCRPLRLPALTCAGDEENAGGPALGLQLIDFGRSLDLELLPPGTLLQVGGWLGPATWQGCVSQSLCTSVIVASA
jgi:hypothetical protein